jgi:hypothetical protein
MGAGGILALVGKNDLAWEALHIEHDAAEIVLGEDAGAESPLGGRQDTLVRLVPAGPPAVRMAHADELRVIPVEGAPL